MDRPSDWPRHAECYLIPQAMGAEGRKEQKEMYVSEEIERAAAAWDAAAAWAEIQRTEAERSLAAWAATQPWPVV